MISWGPIIFGLIFGLIVGVSFRKTEYFNNTSLLVVFIFLIILSYLEGSFPFYTDTSFSLGFLATTFGLIIGNLLFGRKYNSNNDS